MAFELGRYLYDLRQGGTTAGQTKYDKSMSPLLGQLQNTALGQGPSMAQEQFANANAQALQNQLALSRGRNAGQARQAGVNMANINQNLASGMTQAGIQERNQAAQQFMQGTNMQQNNALARNQQYLAALQLQLAQPTNWDKFMQAVTGGAAVLGAL